MKAFFFDVDGTLLDQKTKQIPKSTINILKELRNKGHKIIINTGRVACMLESVLNEIEVDAFVAGCGVHICADNKLLYKKELSIKEANFIKEKLQEYKFESLLEAEDKVYMSKRPFESKGLERLYQVLSSLCEVKLDELSDKTYTFQKFCLIYHKSNENNLFDKFLSEIPDFYFIDRNNSFFEFVPKGHSKASGIYKILDYYNIPKEEAYIFGDSMNDLSMFQSDVKYKILMGKYDKGLEEYASFITKEVLDDGIEYAIKSLGII